MESRKELTLPVTEFLSGHGFIGAENRCSILFLSRHFGANARTVRSWIHEERQQGAQICSSTRLEGYWLAADDVELSEFATSMSRHAIGTFSAAAAARRFVRRNDPQQITLAEVEHGEE